MSVTLNYLPLRARAEATRMILEHGNVPYDYKELSFAEWGEAKGKGEICNFGQLPSIKTVKGTVISQSGAIVRYCAKLAGCFPADIDDAAQADMILELTQDMNLINPLACFFAADSDTYKEKHAAYFGALPDYFASAQKILGGLKYFGGSKPHYGDFALFHICNLTLLVEADSLDATPKLKSWYNTMLNVPAVAAYIARRSGPSTEGFGVPGSYIMGTK